MGYGIGDRALRNIVSQINSGNFSPGETEEAEFKWSFITAK